ncbi:MAG: hypothetical protein KU38_12675 [Sulfurovum sp. FS08-3]|nr:MAG: hypothetical protein KU38_12675 [Sulfurovum sp. FS08-3]
MKKLLIFLALTVGLLANATYESEMEGCPPGKTSGLPDNKVYIADKFNFYKCECTSYVAWKITQNGIKFLNSGTEVNGVWKATHFGNANNWDNAAKSIGLSVDKTPKVGDIAVWETMHVAYVESVNNDGTVTISEYNKNYDHKYTTRNIKITAIDNFIHIQGIALKDFWIKTAPIYANTTNGFDAQFKLVNNGSTAITYKKIALSIHDSAKKYVKDMKIFDNVTINANSTWSSDFIQTNTSNAGSYYAIVKVSKDGTNWSELGYNPFTVTASASGDTTKPTASVSYLSGVSIKEGTSSIGAYLNASDNKALSTITLQVANSSGTQVVNQSWNNSSTSYIWVWIG